MSCGIYKITNLINSKCYIGLSVHIEERFTQHKNPYNWKRENKSLYKAFQKYGLENFSFEIVELCDASELKQKEAEWIKKMDSYHNGYNSTSGGETNDGDNHPGHKLTKKDIIDIRTRYANRERKKEVYQLYKDRIGESGFHKIWNGATWQSIMPEVYTKENKEYHLHDTSNSGSQNGRTRLTEEDVRQIRLRRKNGENIRVVYEDYKDYLTYGSFTNIWSYQNWKNVIV